MSNYSTEDCKKFLAEQYPETQEKKWKRTRKYKDESGVVCRDFSYGTELNVTLQETPHGLIEKQDMEYIITKNLPERYESISINQMLFGGGSSTVNPLNSYEEKFLHVLENGIDWEAEEGERSAYDFSKHINFLKFTQDCESKEVNLVHKFMEHVYASIMFIYELDETYMPHHISTPNFHDSYVDLMEIQKKIEQGYIQNQLVMEVDKDTINGILSTIEETRSSMDCERADIDENECNDILDQMGKMFRKFLGKSPKP